VQFDLRRETKGIHEILIPRGELDIATHTKLREQFDELFDSGRNDLVVDLDETTFLDSTALGALIAARKAAIAGGGSFVLICDNPRIVKLLDITRLSEVFTRFESREAWAASLGGPDAPEV
jgi:anti-sigma B factor antagonist